MVCFLPHSFLPNWQTRVIAWLLSIVKHFRKMDFYFFSFTNTAVFIHCFFHFLMQISGGRAGLTSFSRSFSVHLTEHHMECFMKQFFAPPGRSAGTSVDAVRVQRRCHPNRGVDSARRLRHAVEALRRGLALLISGKAVKKAVHHALPSGTLRGAHVAPQRCTILPKYFCTVVPNITQSERFRQLFD